MTPSELCAIYRRIAPVYYGKERGMIKHRVQDPEAKKAIACPYLECLGKPLKIKLLVIESERGPDRGKTWVYCSGCGGSGPHKDSEGEAVDSWNARVAPGLVERRKA